MVDPVVHITNGIPDAGTGTITTLGQTLLDGSNVVLGATTDLTVAAGAAGTINSHLRTISRDIAGGVVLQSGGNVIGAVTQSGGPWSISGSVGITGTVTVTGTVAATQSGTWNIGSVSGPVALPTGAATAAKQPALGTAGSPSLDVLTIQGAATMTPLKVDGSGVTQPISGNVGITGNVNCVQVTSPWVSSISGNVTCVQSGNWTSRCVGNAGGIFDFSSVQNAATPAQAILIGGEFNASPTSITTGNSSPLQLDSVGSVLVNVKTSTTIPVSQSGNWNMRLQDGAGTAITSTSGALDINIKSGGGSGGTASSFGAAFPASGTAAGAEYLSTPPTLTSGNMAALQVDSSGNLKVNIQAGAGSGGTASSVGGATPSQGTLALGAVTTAAPSYTTATANSLSLDTSGNLRTAVTNTVAVSGTFWQATQPVSGTVTSNQGGAPWTVKPDGTAWAMTSTSANVNVTNASIAVTGTFWQATQPISAASLPLPAGAATSANQPTAAAIASTTSGQTGNLAMGAVSTSAPSYTTAQTNPLSLTTAGALRVDGSATTQPVSGTFWQATQPVSIAAAVTVQQATASNLNATVSGTVTANQGGTWTVQPGNTANTTAWLVTGTGGTFPVTGTFWQATQPVSIAAAVSVNPGTAANWGISSSTYNTAPPANAMSIEAQYTTTPGAMTSGNSSLLQMDANANLRVAIGAGNNYASVKAGSTAPVAADPALVVTLSPNTGPQAVLPVMTTASNGLTASRVVAAASTNATSLKASAGNISAIDVFNVAAYMVFLKLYNKASAPTVGTDTPVWTIPLPGGGAYSADFSTGEYFSTGIAYAITKLQADTDTTAVAAGDVTGRIKWI